MLRNSIFHSFIIIRYKSVIVRIVANRALNVRAKKKQFIDNATYESIVRLMAFETKKLKHKKVSIMII